MKLSKFIAKRSRDREREREEDTALEEKRGIGRLL